MKNENEILKEKFNVYSGEKQDLTNRMNLLRQELNKFEEFASHQKNLLENNKKEYDNLKMKVN